MITDLSKFVKFLSRYGITAHEFMLPYMLYLDDKQKIDGKMVYPPGPNPIAHLFQYHQNVRGWSPSEIKNLEDKNLIENRNPYITEGKERRRKVSPDLMSPTELFKREIFAPETRWEELLQTYPTTVPNFRNPDGPRIPLMMVGEPGALEALETFYNKMVRTKVLHEQIIDLIKWGTERGYINMNISKFISSKYWETLRQLREQEQTTIVPYGAEQA